MNQVRLKELLHYDPETGIFTRKVTTSSNAKAGQVAGFDKPGGYSHIRADGIQYKSHRLEWLYMTGEWPKFEIDHIDNNPHNNRWANLREATGSENCCNRPSKVGVLGVRCVTPHGSGFNVQIGKGMRRYRKKFKTLEEAVEWAEFVRAELHGEFAHAQI